MVEETTSAHKTARGKKGLQSTRGIFNAVKAYCEEMKQAKRDHTKEIVWIAGSQITPVEILHAMDMLPQHVDSVAAVFAAKQLSERFIMIAEEAGYSHDLCAYHKTLLGYLLGGKNIPEVEGIDWPEPDILLGARSVCVLHPLAIRMFQRLLKVPTFMADDPMIHPRFDRHTKKERWYEDHSGVGTGYKHEFEEGYRQYVKGQLKEEIAFLEKVSGKKLDMGRLRETIALSSKGAELFIEIMGMRRNVPCPVGAQDVMPLIGPSFYWAGDQREVDIYQAARDEIKEKVEKGEGTIPDERFRLFFEGIPPWYSLGLFNYMAERKAVSVVETYPFEFCHVMDPDKDPLDNLVDKALSYMYNSSIQERVDLTLAAVKPFHLDGVIHWNSICCKIFTMYANQLRYDVEKEFGIPTLIVDADFADPREYNDALVKNRIDAYFELLEQRKQQEEKKQ